MGLFKFILAILIIIPVAILMIYIFRNLTSEYNAVIKKERDIKSGKYKRDQEFARYAQLKDYRKENPNYDAYRRRMEENNNKKREY
ncbi:MAG: hypothetical protein Q4B18_06525 [Bacillota bacterium]|nr:hypothetical protein [Bacillota bacterium]